MIKYKLLVIDLDGTLLSKFKHISRLNFLAVKDYLQQGGNAIIATGRAIVSAEKYAKQVYDYAGVDGSYVIAFNGAYIKNVKTGKTFKSKIPNDIVQEIKEFARQNKLLIWIYNEYATERNAVYVSHSFANLVIRFGKGVNLLKLRKDHKDLSAYKINLLSFRKNKISKAITFLKNKYKNKLTFSYSHKRLIEINFKDVNKGFGVKYVADQLKIDHQQIAVLGDSNNDLPMFDVANLKIAIKPLSDSLKLKSTYCLDYKKNAVSDAINKYIINNNEILLVASDLDGTLLKDDTKEIDKQAKEMIVQLIDKYNKKFVICTGRSLDNAMLIANYLNVKNQQNLFSIGANGGCIYDVFHQRFIYKKLIDKKVAKQIIDIFLDFQNNKKPLKQIAIEAFTDDDPKNLAKNKIPKHYSINQKFVHDYYAIKHPGMTKNFWINREHEPIDEKTPLDQIMKFVLFFESSEDKARAFALFEKYNNLYEVSSSAKHNLEIMPLNISKGNALQRLCNYLDIDVKNTMTIGDEKNDISMLALSPHSVTLKSSSESVRKAATYVLDAPPSLVVAKAIKSYVLGNKND